LFTDWYDEFTCGNATVTAFDPLRGQASKLTGKSVSGSSAPGRKDALTSGFPRYKMHRRIESGRS